MDSTGRLHAFDNLRAIMMWLGIVIHAAINHITGPSLLPWRDPATTPLADLILVFIHAFRMPVFFIIAGYFVAQFIRRQGHQAMLRHRMRRLALPFAIFWPVLFVCTALLVLMGLHVAAHGSVGIDPSLMPKRSPNAHVLNTMHMWFIYYLICFCLLTAAAVPALHAIPERVVRAADACFLRLASRWWGLIMLTVPLAIIGAGYRAGVLAPDGSFIPNVNELAQHGLFFAFGIMLHRHQDALLPLYTRRSWAHLLAGGVVFILALGAFKALTANQNGASNIVWDIAFLYNLTSWLWSLALIGLFLRFMNRQNPVLRYVSDSSYWVFLVHMLGTIGFSIAMFHLQWGPLTKMALNIFATTAVCLATYHLLVRYTLIGVLLNGRRHPRPARSPAAAGMVP